MKKLISVIFPSVIVSLLWVIGWTLSVSGMYSYLGGKGIFLLGSIIWLGFCFAFFFLAIDGIPTGIRLFSIINFILLVSIFFFLRGHLVSTVDFLYVQNIENPRVAAAAEVIKSDPDKVKTLKDFLAGKEIKPEDWWFNGDSLTVKIAIRRILGVSYQDAEKIRLATDVPIISTSYRIKPEALNSINQKFLAEAE